MLHSYNFTAATITTRISPNVAAQWIVFVFRIQNVRRSNSAWPPTFLWVYRDIARACGKMQWCFIKLGQEHIVPRHSSSFIQ